MRYKSKQEQFWIACSFGREEAARKLIEVGVDVNWRSYVYECYPIHICSQGKPSILKMIIQAGANINALDSGGNTALHHAAMSGNEENVNMLLSSGVDVDIANKNGWTALFNSVYWNHPPITEMLLASGSSPFLKNKNGRIPLHELCRTKSKDSMKILKNLDLLLNSMNKCKQNELSNQAPIKHTTTDLDQSTLDDNVINLNNMSLRAYSQNDLDSEADFTPLLFACYHGHLELVKTLLNRGVDVTVTDKNHWTALHWAAQRCHADIVEVLLDHGASIHAKDSSGCMPYAVTNDIGLQECLSPNIIEYPNIISNGHVTTDDEDDSSNDAESSHFLTNSIHQMKSSQHLQNNHHESLITKQLDLLKLSLIDNQIEQLTTAETASPEIYIGTT